MDQKENNTTPFDGMDFSQIIARAEKDQAILGDLVAQEVQKLLTA